MRSWLCVALLCACDQTARVPEDPVEDDPILERVGSDEIQCSVAKDLTVIGPNWLASSLVDAPEGLAVAHLEGADSTQLRIVLSPLQTEPALEIGPELFSAQATAYAVAAAARASDTGLIWAESDTADTWLRFARIDAQGAVLAGPMDLAATRAPQIASVVAVATENGFALAWSAGDYAESEVRFALLGADGTLGAITRIGPGWVSSEPVVREDGFLITFAARESDTQVVKSATLDAAGALRTGPTSLTLPGTGLDNGSPHAIAWRGGYLAAWVEGRWSLDHDEASEVIRVAHLDAQGALAGAPSALQAPVVDVSNARPVLLELDGHVALAWSKGSIIYVCGGCMADHELDLVHLDGDALVPLSNVVTLAGPSGLFARALRRSGSELVTLADVSYHTWVEGSAATYSCPSSR